MATPYTGEVRLLPYFRGAPEGWQKCDGSLLSIAQYSLLSQLLGTTYGGDGNTTFGVPDLRSRVPLHQGNGPGLTPRSLGQIGGSDSVTLSRQQMGAHAHYLLASAAPGTGTSPAATVLAGLPAGVTLYNTTPGDTSPTAFPSSTLQPSGQSQAHDNTAPTLALQYCIATEGICPAQP